MEKTYFAMMYNQNGTTAMPIMTSDEEGENEQVMFWGTFEEAEDSMKNHHFAKSFGYDIFSMGDGL